MNKKNFITKKCGSQEDAAQKIGGKLILESDNKSLFEYKYPEELDKSELEAIRIIGRVVNRSGLG